MRISKGTATTYTPFISASRRAGGATVRRNQNRARPRPVRRFVVASIRGAGTGFPSCDNGGFCRARPTRLPRLTVPGPLAIRQTISGRDLEYGDGEDLPYSFSPLI